MLTSSSLLFTCRKQLDVLRLETAWLWLVRRHEILRARFVWEGVDQPRQEIVSGGFGALSGLKMHCHLPEHARTTRRSSSRS